MDPRISTWITQPPAEENSEYLDLISFFIQKKMYSIAASMSQNLNSPHMQEKVLCMWGDLPMDWVGTKSIFFETNTWVPFSWVMDNSKNAMGATEWFGLRPFTMTTEDEMACTKAIVSSMKRQSTIYGMAPLLETIVQWKTHYSGLKGSTFQDVIEQKVNEMRFHGNEVFTKTALEMAIRFEDWDHERWKNMLRLAQCSEVETLLYPENNRWESEWSSWMESYKTNLEKYLKLKETIAGWKPEVQEQELHLSRARDLWVQNLNFMSSEVRMLFLDLRMREDPKKLVPEMPSSFVDKNYATWSEETLNDVRKCFGTNTKTINTWFVEFGLRSEDIDVFGSNPSSWSQEDTKEFVYLFRSISNTRHTRPLESSVLVEEWMIRACEKIGSLPGSDLQTMNMERFMARFHPVLFGDALRPIALAMIAQWMFSNEERHFSASDANSPVNILKNLKNVEKIPFITIKSSEKTQAFKLMNMLEPKGSNILATLKSMDIASLDPQSRFPMLLSFFKTKDLSIPTPRQELDLDASSMDY